MPGFGPKFASEETVSVAPPVMFTPAVKVFVPPRVNVPENAVVFPWPTYTTPVPPMGALMVAERFAPTPIVGTPLAP